MDLIISMGINVVLEALKDPKKKQNIRKAALKVFKQIAVVFGPEKEFQGVMAQHFTGVE